MAVPVGSDLLLDVMAEIAQPLDEWCAFHCGRLATVTSADGVRACEGCAKQVLEAMAKFEADVAFLASKPGPRDKPGPREPNRRKRRAKNKVAKASRKRNRR